MKATINVTASLPYALLLLMRSDGFAPHHSLSAATAKNNIRGCELLREYLTPQNLGGLTDDGDFLLLGINGDDPLQTDREATKESELAAEPSGGQSSAIPSADASIDMSVVSSFASTARPDTTKKGDPSPLADNSQLSGLTDDGDLLITGINGDDPLQSDANEEGSSLLSSSSPPSPSFGLKLTSADDSIDMAAVARFKEQEAARGRPDRSVVARDNNNHADEGASWRVEEWLLQMIPTLQEGDLTTYARELVDIGFDPGCITQCELQWDDLGF
eukprot:CAMPEP_0178591156 /NCGR_PEP_ID=MMETSP0697-20121206/28631_1 /TAXON_ID=265572 /ORGANISM="Extubocellulus spinifer, Strain CCMP396" /LENGTH=273 /DNA_ID=CAMNT_0020227983 /DNA_START=125 /DNA_END=943 /DNA_ORIENTATION=+